MKPLAGCRVLDLGIITAGAATSALLADFGAEVIKIEAPSYRDPFRRWLSDRPADADPTLSPFFRATNRGKLGLSLDLKHPLGRAAFLRLAGNSHVVVENFRRGVLPKMGLDFPALTAANPAIVLASISSQGEDGPDAGYVSYGSTLEAVAGLAWSTGYAGGPPTLSGVDLNYPDQIVALFAASMILTAWADRERRDGGVHLDLSQRELTSFLIGETFVAAGAGLEIAREGNAQAPYALQDCFAARDGRWIAVSVPAGAVAALDAAGIGLDALPGWIARHDSAHVLDRLQALNIPAEPALNGREVMAAGVWTQALVRTPAGHLAKGFPLQFAGEPLTITREAPGIGADSEEVLRRVGGMTDQEIGALYDAGVIEPGPTAQGV